VRAVAALYEITLAALLEHAQRSVNVDDLSARLVGGHASTFTCARLTLSMLSLSADGLQPSF
jgi:hypothetical protein